MNQLEYISTITTNLHGHIEAWARNLLREAGIDTIEVYGQFPPEGSVASHIVLFPYRLGSLENQISQPVQDISLLRTDITKIPVGTVPPLWSVIGRAITMCIHEKYPKMTKGPFIGRPHPAPPIDSLPEPLANWYRGQGDTKKTDAWVTDIAGNLYARLPSLAWSTGVLLKIQYLIAVGEGARGTADRLAPVAIQTLSVLASGAQLRNTLNMRIPPVPYPEELPSFLEAVADSMENETGEQLREQIPLLDKKMDMAVGLLPGSNLTNADFTGLMQALQRPLQPTLNLAVQISIGGAPKFAPGISADLRSHQKARR
jgi:hypothetical protein